MRRGALAACAAAAILIGPPAFGQPRPELDGPTQLEMNQQADARFKIADRELNAAYRKLVAQASAGGRERLRQAQRAWIAFRDLDCAARAGSRGGSFHPAAVSLCLEAVTDDRTRTLQAELNCAEGDMGCGGHVD
ncbi:MAG: DUF1311 domain-containing protein [Phenylobacterium sp.]|uniref:lysozyme inhibitor LprI family protein n=1 Tax=Phenylobacterium sp. TaxID=1871053 RepID=UPI0012051DA8|nr:lysozyme inhibitor LprI family protein [Phenylobacterium sp.]TAJ73157.1 MAG: DUF1311 domain-containing protein [Phenylobacterium sp.]